MFCPGESAAAGEQDLNSQQDLRPVSRGRPALAGPKIRVLTSGHDGCGPASY